jgi:hypothetical protein
MVLHRVVVRFEKALNQQETAFGVFLDIKLHLTIPATTRCLMFLSVMVLNTP